MTTPSKTRWRRAVGRLARVAVLVYLGLCVAAYCGQDWLLFPGRRPAGQPPRAFRFGPGSERVDLTAADGTPVAAVFGPAADAQGVALAGAATRPTVLFFYGNAGSVEGSWEQFDHLRRLGVNVMIPDLPGYGASGGTASEAHFYAAADAAFDALSRRPDVDPHRVIVAGWSLGAGLAVDLAARRPVAALATFNAFTTLPEMAGHFLPWLPGRYLCRYRFDNLAKIRRVRCPTLVCNGVRDQLVPPAMSDRLAAAAGGPVTRVRLPDADHNTVFDADPDLLWPAIRQLVERVADGPTEARPVQTAAGLFP